MLFFGGMLGLAWQVVEVSRGKAVEPTLLAFFAAMLGLPAFLRSDKK